GQRAVARGQALPLRWLQRRGGVTGSHAGLRILSRKGCGFDSRPRHSADAGGLAHSAKPQAAYLVCIFPTVYDLAWRRRDAISCRQRTSAMFPRTRWVGLVILLFASAVPAQAQTALRYKFKPGEKLVYVVENKMTMK